LGRGLGVGMRNNLITVTSLQVDTVQSWRGWQLAAYFSPEIISQIEEILSEWDENLFSIAGGTYRKGRISLYLLDCTVEITMSEGTKGGKLVGTREDL